MSRLMPISRIAVVALALFTFQGCAAVDDILSGVDKPTARVVDVGFIGFDAQSVTLDFAVEIANPYSVDLPVLGLDYALASSGATFLTGQSQGGTSIPATGRSVLNIPARIGFSEALSLISGIAPGNVVPYDADIGINVDAPALGNLRVPLSKSGEFPIPTVPEVQVNNIDWDVGLTGAAAVLDLGIKNTNDFPVDLSKLAYDLKLAGNPVIRSGASQAVSFSPGANESMQLNFNVSPMDVGRAVFGLFSGSGADYQMGGTMDLNTPFGPISLPYSSNGQTSFK